MYSLGKHEDDELIRLRNENLSLTEELTQCRADKEFVWSLWKRLQVASPDITQAVGMVVQREKEKAELKDHKILEILQMKDDKLDELQKVVTGQSKELSLLTARKLELQDEKNKLQLEVKQLQTAEEQRTGKVNDLQGQTYSKEDVNRETIRELDKHNLELKQQLNKLKTESEALQKDKDDLTAIRDSHKHRLQTVEDELNDFRTRYDKVVKEHAEAKRAANSFETRLSTIQRDTDYKNRELEKVRKELSELWETHSQTTGQASQQADIIRQLQLLQRDSQQMLQNQEDAFSLEAASMQTTYQTMKATEMELRLRIQQHMNDLAQKDDIIYDLEQQLEGKHAGTQVTLGTQDKDIQAFRRDPESENRIESLQGELSAMRTRLQEKNRIIEEYRMPTMDKHRRSRTESRGRKTQRGVAGCGRRPSPAVGSKGPLRTRSFSPHPESDIRILQRKLANTERQLEDARLLLQVKSQELEEVRAAHNKRLDRLKSLQTNFRLVKKQLQILEEECYGKKKKKRPLERSEPKSLQKEDSDTVWNELNYFKNENKNLAIDRMNLQEEVDSLRVQSAQDAATIHELRACLEQEREELQFVVEQQENRSRSPSPSREQNLERNKQQLARLQTRISGMKEENLKLHADRDRLYEEKKSVKAELNQLLQQAANQRIQMSDLKGENARLQRELKRKRKKGNGKTDIAKQYQLVLNKSINQMSSVFDDFDKDGWEEITETTDMTTDQSPEVTQTTMDSLGQQIVQQAVVDSSGPVSTSTPSPKRTAPRVRPTPRQVESIEGHFRRMTKSSDTPTTEVSPSHKTGKSHPITYRSIASSPIHFQSPHHLVSSSRKTPTSGASRRQLTSLKQRVSGLQQQVGVLRQAKDAATRGQQEYRANCEQLQSDLSLTNQRLHTTKLTVQRLTSDIERLKAEKEAIESQLEEGSIDTQNTTTHSELEWAQLQAKLKNANNEVSRQLAQIKDLKADNAAQLEKLQLLQDKVTHQERDIAQKRTLVEDMRMKLKFTQDNASSDAQVMSEVEAKLKSLAETNNKYKTQVDSLKQRLSTVAREKTESQHKVLKLSDEIEKKSKQATELQKKNGQLQNTVIAIERTAQQQLHTLADQSETAIDTAQNKLGQVSVRLQEYNKFTKFLAHALLNSVQQARALFTQQKIQKVHKAKQLVAPPSEPDSSIKHVQNLACDILNLSQADLDDLMSCHEDDDTVAEIAAMSKTDDAKKDKRWVKKWEKVLQSQAEFAMPLVELFMQKVEERSLLAVEMTVSS